MDPDASSHDLTPDMDAPSLFVARRCKPGGGFLRHYSRTRRALVAAAATGILTMAFASPASAAAGNLDPTFGTGGKVTTDFSNSYDVAYGAAIQTDGKIVVAGETAPDQSSPKFAIARYNTDGSL